MIMYKLNEINERIDEMNKNITSIKEQGENEIQEDIQKYRSEKDMIIRNKDLTETGKDNKIDELSRSYYDKNVAKGEKLIQKIAYEYDSAIERVNELKQFDDERKIVNDSKAKDTDVIKANTNLMYSIQVLNNIDKDYYGYGELKSLLEQNQDSEKILKLIELKVNRLKKDGADSSELNEVVKDLEKFNIDYVGQLENAKLNNDVFYKKYEYPRIINRVPIKELFEVDKVEFKQFYAENRKKDKFNQFIAK